MVLPSILTSNGDIEERNVYIVSDTCMKNKKSPLQILTSALEIAENGIRKGTPVILNFRKPLRRDNGKTKQIRKYHLRLPGSTSDETWKFAVYLKVIKLLAQTLKVQQIKTRRDLFYHDVSLFKTQKTVDDCLETLCCSLEVEGYELGAIPSQKGLVFGNLRVCHPATDSVQVIDENLGPVLIPLIFPGCIVTVDKSVEYILVVEKEAVFKALTASTYVNRVVVTGKGFPDHLTRSFISQLRQDLDGVPIYCLTDSDIYGLLIYSSYKKALETSRKQNSLIYLGAHLLDYEDGYLDISGRDINMLKNFISRCLTLEQSLMDVDASIKVIKKEAQRGIYMLKKSEMNVVGEKEYEFDYKIEHYISKRISCIKQFAHN